MSIVGEIRQCEDGGEAQLRAGPIPDYPTQPFGYSGSIFSNAAPGSLLPKSGEQRWDGLG